MYELVTEVTAEWLKAKGQCTHSISSPNGRQKTFAAGPATGHVKPAICHHADHFTGQGQSGTAAEGRGGGSRGNETITAGEPN